ncbi:MAG: hypothetical protein A2836_00875 [Candidatus Taylorbacteria bacterium RIFCSPHIGHO2_01_FULL_45_63]|uniref:DUF5671 domain-containing protein n=1 Tax=Candidatus Taylorbacteria bacterium RIFCSPHIGHO2_02_FULL_45_35 TaxID=1802311 RepID=A0A1G2MQR0_9BACT|nr:MAG: hypothetical protein A2836_00875 [Candidatus Taylorbacteria bacterium RIFCSPHIGHO2_01_FULL_45_63]OHA26084.1 MAG: hypothetical protein A3D56_02090 [Candidatus Taylorbacteria bacterium RIFCSPHIGHO2_02_FULL_45_35]OHA32488.1 MAG: hypothetical protein A3A22_00140 [Candidatus Taylorbacteria bacterium RIFCSPLOWO2_01_FULL_45_34b]
MDITQKPKTTPKDFFLHLGALVTLYISVTSLLTLLFEIINSTFPDNLTYYVDPYSTGMRLAIASLIIIFPIYIFLSWLLAKDVKGNPEKRELGIRKWLTFFTLFVAGIAMMVDLVVLVNTFLNGEITTRFILKVVSVLVVAGAIFAYYIYDIRKDWQTNTKGLKTFAWIACLAVLISVIGGFIVMGSPATARKMRFDERRVSDLQSIQWQIVNYWQQKGELPKTLFDLEDSISGFTVPSDPEIGPGYNYSMSVGSLSFKLCANFSLESDDKISRGGYKSIPYPVTNEFGGAISENWKHGTGETCFDRTIDPKLYPVRVK